MDFSLSDSESEDISASLCWRNWEIKLGWLECETYENVKTLEKNLTHKQKADVKLRKSNKKLQRKSSCWLKKWVTF